MISPIPTLNDIQAAEKAVEIAFAEYDADCLAHRDPTESLIEYKCAIEHALSLKFERDRALIMGVIQ